MCVRLRDLFLHVDDDELHGEADDVAGVQAVPDGQEQQRGHLREDLIAQEFQPLEHMPSKTQTQRKKHLQSRSWKSWKAGGRIL